MIGQLADLFYYLFHCFLTGIVGFYHVAELLPWPTGDDWFRWFLFLILGKFVWYTISSQFSRKTCRKCSAPISEHGAAAGVGALFGHH